jgi:hypothetical protein
VVPPGTTAGPIATTPLNSTLTTTSASWTNVPGDYVPSSTWETVAAAEAGWDTGRLDEALAFAESRATRALVLVDGGRIVARRYVGVDRSFRRTRPPACHRATVLASPSAGASLSLRGARR